MYLLKVGASLQVKCIYNNASEREEPKSLSGYSYEVVLLLKDSNAHPISISGQLVGTV